MIVHCIKKSDLHFSYVLEDGLLVTYIYIYIYIYGYYPLKVKVENCS